MKPFLFSLLASFFILLISVFIFQPIAVVLPHHNLVQTTRQEFLKKISHQRLITRKIILIGPDHFSINQNQINISNQDWNLSTGLLKFQDLNLNLPVNNNLLKNDHAFYNPLADLKNYFPYATVYPISIGQKIDSSSLNNLISQVSNICGFDCLLVVSVDFSHYLPATLADVHDAYTLTNLQNLDSSSIQLSEVDSPQSLYFLIKYTLLKNAKSWHLFAHTNSGFLVNNPDIETTTHVFGYYNFGFNYRSNNFTSTLLPYSLDRSQNQNTLGDRFFYGTNFFLNNSTLPNFVIGQIKNPTQNIEIFLPIKNNVFIRGFEKQQLVKDYFDSVPNSSNLTKDYFWGKLIYD